MDRAQHPVLDLSERVWLDLRPGGVAKMLGIGVDGETQGLGRRSADDFGEREDRRPSEDLVRLEVDDRDLVLLDATPEIHPQASLVLNEDRPVDRAPGEHVGPHRQVSPDVERR